METYERMQAAVQKLIEASGAKRVSVVYRNVETGDTMSILPGATYHPASTFKLCVTMELYRQAAEEMFSLDETITVKNSFRSIADGSAFSLTAEDDADQSLYERVGERETLRQLNRLMIVRSSNLATNLLVELVGAERVTRFMAELGAPSLIVRRGPEDNRAYALGMNNVATAEGLAHVLWRLARGEVVSPAASREMVEVLQRQEFSEGIPSGLPSAVQVAHKTGWNERLYHDAGIVYPMDAPPYVLAVMTEGLEELEQGPRLVAAVSREVYGG